MHRTPICSAWLLVASAAATSATADAQPAQPGLLIVETDEVALRLSGYVQADWVVYQSTSEEELNPSTREPLNEMLFSIPRARLRADFEHEIFGGIVEFDGNTNDGPTARILDVEAIARWRNPTPGAPPYLLASIGSMKIPFGVEVPESERLALFLEKTNAARALFPGNYDL